MLLLFYSLQCKTGEIVRKRPSLAISTLISVGYLLSRSVSVLCEKPRGKVATGSNFACYLHVTHIVMHMVNTCSQNTVSMTHSLCFVCTRCVCTCTFTSSSLLLHSCCNVCCLGCHVFNCHGLTSHLGFISCPKTAGHASSAVTLLT